MMNSLSGNFRTNIREQSAIVHCRAKLKLSINQIARLMRRSRATVHKYVNGVGYDNRRRTNRLRRHLNMHFNRTFKELRLRVKMYLEGLCSFDDAVHLRNVPLVTLDWFLRSENSGEEEEEDPA